MDDGARSRGWSSGYCGLDLLFNSLSRLLVYSLSRLLVYSLSRLLVYSLSRLLVYSLSRLLVYSLSLRGGGAKYVPGFPV